jgi:hypothetical protein
LFLVPVGFWRGANWDGADKRDDLDLQIGPSAEHEVEKLATPVAPPSPSTYRLARSAMASQPGHSGMWFPKQYETGLRNKERPTRVNLAALAHKQRVLDSHRREKVVTCLTWSGGPY